MTDGTRAPTREIGDDATAEVAERAREELLTPAATLLPLHGRGRDALPDPQTWSVESWIGRRGVRARASSGRRSGSSAPHGGGRTRRDACWPSTRSCATSTRASDAGPRRTPRRRDFVRGRFLGWLCGWELLALPLVWGQWDEPAWAVPGACCSLIAAPSSTWPPVSARPAPVAAGAPIRLARRVTDEAHRGAKAAGVGERARPLARRCLCAGLGGRVGGRGADRLGPGGVGAARRRPSWSGAALVPLRQAPDPRGDRRGAAPARGPGRGAARRRPGPTRASHWPARRGRRGGSLSPCSSCPSPAWWSASSAETSGTPPPPWPFSPWRSAPSSWTGSPGSGPAAGWTLRPTPLRRSTGDRAHGSRGRGRLGRGRAARTATGGPALPHGLRRLPGSPVLRFDDWRLIVGAVGLALVAALANGGMDVPPRTDRADGPLPRAARPAHAHRPRPGPAHADR